MILLTGSCLQWHNGFLVTRSVYCWVQREMPGSSDMLSVTAVFTEETEGLQRYKETGREETI